MLFGCQTSVSSPSGRLGCTGWGRVCRTDVFEPGAAAEAGDRLPQKAAGGQRGAGAALRLLLRLTFTKSVLLNEYS
eukprot:1110886-Prorocentrum_minimum.AAC.1